MTGGGDRRRERQRRRAVRKAKQNRAKARANLLAQHRKLAARRAENRRRSTGDDDGDGPHSTVPPTDTEDESATGPRHSTVPRRPRGSDDDPPVRLYGLRLRRAAKGDDGEGESR